MRHILSAAVVVLLIAVPARAQQPRGDHASRPYLGVTLAPSDRGVIVRDVTPDSPAAKAGLAAGDRIIKIDNHDLSEPNGLIRLVASKKPNDQVTLRVASKDQERDVQVRLGEWPAGHMGPLGGRPFTSRHPGDRRPAFLGVQTQPLSPEIRQQNNLIVDSGIIVIDVTPGSPAAQAGMRRNDEITKVNDKEIRDVERLREFLQQVGADNEATIQIARGAENITLKAKLADAMFGMFAPQAPAYPMSEMGSMMPQPPRLAELERRIHELENRIKELEAKQSPRTK
jgi:S1-C subfamily serine protease